MSKPIREKVLVENIFGQGFVRVSLLVRSKFFEGEK